MRLFVAVEIDPDVARRISELSDELRRRVTAFARRARITWIPAERLHLTLRFIGEVDEGKAAAIGAALEPKLNAGIFDVVIRGAGVFPASGPPRVLWAGIAEGADALVDLEHEVSTRLAGCGVPREERAFSPHLTLARVREASGLRSGPLLDGVTDRVLGATRVDAITLFESRSSPKGPTYVSLQRTPLRA